MPDPSTAELVLEGKNDQQRQSQYLMGQSCSGNHVEPFPVVPHKIFSHQISRIAVSKKFFSGMEGQRYTDLW
jgi:hypothetical protein